MKKVISVFLICVLLLSLAACAQTPAGSGEAQSGRTDLPESVVPSAVPGESGGGTPEDTPAPQPDPVLPGELSFAASYEEIYKALQDIDEGDEEAMRYGVIRDYFATDSNEAVEEPVPDGGSEEYSGTNVQVSGIDEGDIVKTDGEHIYILQDGARLIVLSAEGAATQVLSTTELGYMSLSATPLEDLRSSAGQERQATELFISGDTLAVIYDCWSWFEEFKDGSGWSYDKNNRTEIEFYDVSDPAKPSHTATLGQDGSVLGTRLYEGRLYVLTQWSSYNYKLRDEMERMEDLIPALYENESRVLLNAEDICICTESSSTAYVVAAAYDMTGAEALGAQGILGGGNMVYMSGENIYVAGRTWLSGESEPRTEGIYTVVDYAPSTNTRLFRFSITESGPELTGSALVPGYLESRFSMDEYGGCLRLVTTVSRGGYTVYIDEEKNFVNYDWHFEDQETNSLYILGEDLQLMGCVEDLAEGERVYSARFDGDMAYFCTFEQVDPLFAVDCSDPKNPVVLSALKISGFSEYLHHWGENQLFGFGYEADESTGWIEGLKMVMFDTTDKTDVVVENFLHLKDVMWSEALYEPHAFFISPEHDIIGFVGDGTYYIYGYSSEKGFYERAKFDFHGWEYNSRGLYIGNEIYLIGRDGGYVLDLESCEIIKNLYW